MTAAQLRFCRLSRAYQHQGTGHPNSYQLFVERALALARPGGRVGLIWNARDRSVPWVDAMWTIMDRVEKRAPWREHDEWRDTAFVDQPWFTPLTEATFHHEQRLTRDEAVDRMRSVSHIAVLPPAEQAEVLDGIRAVLDSDPAIADREVVALPYRVDAYWVERR